MNKRQKKKRNTIIAERIQFFKSRFIMSARKNGKNLLMQHIYKACWDKRYKPFKLLKKEYNKIFCAIDWSNGKDYSVMTRYKTNNGVISVISQEISS